MLHRTRELLVRQRTALVHSLRGQLAEFGLITPKAIWSLPDLHALAQGATSAVLPDAVRSSVDHGT
jgi:transposase